VFALPLFGVSCPHLLRGVKRLEEAAQRSSAAQRHFALKGFGRKLTVKARPDLERRGGIGEGRVGDGDVLIGLRHRLEISRVASVSHNHLESQQSWTKTRTTIARFPPSGHVVFPGSFGIPLSAGETHEVKATDAIHYVVYTVTMRATSGGTPRS